MKKETSNLIKASDKKYDTKIEKLLKPNDGADMQNILRATGYPGNGNYDATMENLRMMWRKEKNRIAAKKSREKKANLMIELEKKEMHLSNEVDNLKRLLIEYENIIEVLLRYIKFTVMDEIIYGGENTDNKVIKSKDGNKDRKEIYKKLIRCLEYHYHIRNNENYVLPYDSRNNYHHVSNRLIDEILFSLKNSIRYFEIPK